MPSINRTTIISGPALVQFTGQSFWSKGDVVIKPVHARWNVETAHFGKLGERFSDRRYEVTFEPSGRFTAALGAVLWPYADTPAGASVFGPADNALVVHSRDGRKVTLHNAAVTEMPAIRFAVDKTSVGNVKFTGLLKNNTDPSAAGAYLTEAAQAYPGDAGFSVADIFSAATTAWWGASAPWHNFLSESGWEVTFQTRLAEQKVDGLGTVDMTLQNIDVSLKGIPVGPSVADILAALKSDTALGSSLAGDNNFLITPAIEGAPYILLTKAALVDADIGYGATRKRIGTCEWIPTRTITEGVAAPLFEIGASDG